MATRKGGSGPQIDNDFLNTIKGIKAGDTTTQEQHPVEPSTQSAGPATSDKKTLITAKVNESTLKAWKQFCLDHDTNLTAVIKSAMNHYIKDVQSGTIEI